MLTHSIGPFADSGSERENGKQDGGTKALAAVKNRDQVWGHRCLEGGGQTRPAQKSEVLEEHLILGSQANIQVSGSTQVTSVWKGTKAEIWYFVLSQYMCISEWSV